MEADKVGNHFSRIFFIETIDRLDTGVRHFFHVVGKFHNGNLFPIRFFHRHFKDAPQSGSTVGRDDFRTHAPRGDGTSLRFEGLDGIFVKIVGTGNNGIREAGFGKHTGRFLREIGDISAVDADPVFPGEPPLFFQFFKHLNCMGHAHFKNIVGVGQEDEIVMILANVFAESIYLFVKAHDPAVGHRTENGDAEPFSRFHIGCAVEPSDHGGPCAPEPGRMPLRAAETELHQGVFRRHSAHTPCFRGDEAFMIHNHG